MSAALHAVIAAIFARIFTRLEQILLLWQAGNLVPLPPAPHLATAPRVLPPAAHRAARRLRARRTARAIPAPAIPAPAAIIRALNQIARAAHPRRATGIHPHPRPHQRARPRPQPAHDPPPLPSSQPCQTSPRGCTSISI